MEPGSCCDVYECVVGEFMIKMFYLHKCVVYKCGGGHLEGYSPRKIANRNMEPGFCCDVYECVVGKKR